MNAYGLTCFELTISECMRVVSDCLTDVVYLVIKGDFSMDLVIYDACFIHDHMNPLWSVALG